MDTAERVSIVHKMRCLVNELYKLETAYKACAPPPAPVRSDPPVRPQLPCFMLKCHLPRCRSNPDLEPLITWTPVCEVRKTTNPKMLEKQKDDPSTKYVFVEPPCSPYKPVWTTRDAVCEDNCAPVRKDCPALGPPPGSKGAPVDLCCPPVGPPVDSRGTPYECQVTLDGRTVCKPGGGPGPTVMCGRGTELPKCEDRKIYTRSNVISTRKTNFCDDASDSRTSGLYKRPIYPSKTCCTEKKSKCNPRSRRS